MNCQQFTSFIVEMARGQMMDAASRDAAMRHAESCQACAARLAQEQSLTNALRAVAHDMKDASAPARVEAKLLAAFQSSLAQTDAPAATGATHAPLPLNAARAKAAARRRLAFAAIAAVAASLVLVVLASLYVRFTRTGSPSSQEIASSGGQTVSEATPPGKESAIAAPSPLASSTEPERQTKSATTGTIQVGAAKLSTVKQPRNQRPPTMIKAQHVIDGGNAIIEASEGETVAANAPARPVEAESVTEFISLMADAPATSPLESGQLVRVQVPRAALASLGLPLNAERGNEPVKADVLLGGDGLARAIRFVR
ncbi:MAG TPA: hypothetical protein VGO96_13655 [Pyrinomonadaceae bacterium]|jgi:hypothetical protein|nr:hypothetical protein [Pyrinomonadaceae bacterium]